MTAVFLIKETHDASASCHVSADVSRDIAPNSPPGALSRDKKMGRHQPRPAASFLLFFVLFSVCFVFTLPSVSADDEVEISSQDEILADDSLTGTSQAEESADDDDEDEDGDEDEEAIPEDEDEATKSASTGKIEWVETYDGALYEARFGEAGSRWVVLMVQDDSRWTTELLQRLDHSAEAARLARDHFVMAKVTEEDLPTYARLRFNAVQGHPIFIPFFHNLKA